MAIYGITGLKFMNINTEEQHDTKSIAPGFNDLKSQLEILQARVAGKQVEIWNTKLSPPRWDVWIDTLTDFHSWFYRIKAEKKKVFLKGDDLPMPCFIKYPNHTVYAVVKYYFNPNPTSWLVEYASGKTHAIDALILEQAEYSADGKNWKKFVTYE